jgi:hypothetical protein
MERYNFQINNPKKWKDWSEIPIHIRHFKHRQDAIVLAQRTARIYKTEVRMATGSRPLAANGAYIRG